MNGTLSAGTLKLTGGTITTGVGARATNVDLSLPGTGVANATNPLAITTQLKVPAGVVANYTPGGAATAFTASGSNLADNSVARTLALSGGTLALAAAIEPTLGVVFDARFGIEENGVYEIAVFAAVTASDISWYAPLDPTSGVVMAVQPARYST